MTSPVEVGIAVAGAAFIGGAISWRATARREARSAVRSALVSPNASTRIAALRMIASEGIGPVADLLQERVAAEDDPEVRRVLAEVVAQSQWEPSSDEALVELRLWAHRELQSPPDKRAEGEPEPERSEPEPSWWERVSPAESPTVVLVTGAGGPAGVSVIRWLKAAGHRIIAVDADPLAVGFRLADGAAVVRRSDDPGFVASIKAAARAAGAKVLVPTVAEELPALAAAEDDLSSVGLSTFLPDPEAVLNCTDKWRFAKVTQSSGVRTPLTNLGSAEGVPGPWVVKPRFGRGSRDIFYVEDRGTLAYALARVADPIVQTRLVGREFTADVLVGRDGTLGGVVPRWRLETRGGISTRGETFTHPVLVGEVARLMGALGLIGPANVQGFVDTDDEVAFTEVNPRFSGGLPLSLAAGADLLGEYVRVAEGEVVRPERCAYRAGVVMLRYFEEIFNA